MITKSFHNVYVCIIYKDISELKFKIVGKKKPRKVFFKDFLCQNKAGRKIGRCQRAMRLAKDAKKIVSPSFLVR